MPMTTSAAKRQRLEEAPDIVCLEYDDLTAGKDLTAEIRSAYGPGGFGILYVRGVPGLEKARQALLPLSRKLALLPENILSKYECEPPVVGWSRGKERFKGKPDRAKGSFYANPLFDDAAEGDEEALKRCKQTLPNVWPTEVPELEEAFKTMGKLVYEVAKPIVKQVDKLVSDNTAGNPPANLFQRTFPESKMIVARLLHYYAISENDGVDEWCGWHNDNSTITGLVPALWLEEETGSPISTAPTGAGLFVEGRNGEQIEVRPPKDCLGFQIGEASQILSGGVVHATPHMVKGYTSPVGAPKLSRETFAIFIQPNWDGLLAPPPKVEYSAIFEGREESKLIPALRARLPNVPATFGDFLQGSFKHYYEMNNPDDMGS
jgi:isopenicillin N synthase-like dioxygenase